MAIQALLFDLWGTLLHVRDVDDTEARRRRLLDRTVAGLADAGHAHAEEAVAEALAAFNEEHTAMHAEGRDVSEPERLEMVLEHLQPGLAARMSAGALRMFEDAVGGGRRGAGTAFPAPGANEVLDEAHRRGFALGLVSVTGLTPGYVLREIMDALGLLGHFAAITFSDEARMAKPTPEVFHCTLETLGVGPQEAVFIGDSPIPDIAGPQAIGMWTVQIGGLEQPGVEPHARIDALSELFPALERLGLLD